VSELSNGIVRTYVIKPEDFGITRALHQDILGGSARENAEIIKNILAGKKGPHRDIVLINAAHAIAAAGIVENPRDAFGLACNSIDSGAAQEKLRLLREKTSA